MKSIFSPTRYRPCDCLSTQNLLGHLQGGSSAMCLTCDEHKPQNLQTFSRPDKAKPKRLTGALAYGIVQQLPCALLAGGDFRRSGRWGRGGGGRHGGRRREGLSRGFRGYRWRRCLLLLFNLPLQFYQARRLHIVPRPRQQRVTSFHVCGIMGDIYKIIQGG